MTQLQHRAVVHPRTVTDLSKGAVRVPRRRSAPRSTNSGVTVGQVNPIVWETALRLAGGNPRRIQIVSLTEVLIHNG